MDKLRIELCKNKLQADNVAQLLLGLGFKIKLQSPYKFIWTTAEGADPVSIRRKILFGR
jgi:hypothetical protein